MTKPTTLLITTALSTITLLTTPVSAHTSQPASPGTTPERQAELVIVTGSNIRRDGFTERAPVQVFGENAVEVQAAPIITAFIANLPANAG
jgi:hypothetical protein